MWIVIDKDIFWNTDLKIKKIDIEIDIEINTAFIWNADCTD